MATTPNTVHVPGSLPANGTTIGFDWGDPLNANIKATYQETVQIIDRCRAVAKAEVQAVEDGQALLAAVEARNLTLLQNLPPFPLEGTNAGLTIQATAEFEAMWQASLQWMSSQQTVTMTVAVQNPDSSYTLNPDGTLVTAPVTFTKVPLDVFRRFMSNPAG